jgi:hypothetical protein
MFNRVFLLKPACMAGLALIRPTPEGGDELGLVVSGHRQDGLRVARQVCAPAE